MPGDRAGGVSGCAGGTEPAAGECRDGGGGEDLEWVGVSNRRLYLVAQFFATKPVEHLVGPGITAEQLYDDCLGRTLDWLYEHDPTALFAGIAR
jgi:Domain of unknown function (DUF4277)